MKTNFTVVQVHPSNLLPNIFLCLVANLYNFIVVPTPARTESTLCRLYRQRRTQFVTGFLSLQDQMVASADWALGTDGFSKSKNSRKPRFGIDLGVLLTVDAL